MQANPSSSNDERLLRLPEVESRVGLKKSAIYAGCSAKPPTFPVPIKLSPRAVAWPESAIQAWIAGRIKASQGA
jgi:prophage regulatory protein